MQNNPVSHSGGRLKSGIDFISSCLIFLGIVLIPFSASLDNLLAVGALIYFVCNREPTFFRFCQRQPVVWLSLALIYLLFIGVLYSIADYGFAWHEFQKYSSKLIALVLLIVFFQCEHRRALAEKLFIVSCLLMALILMLDTFHWIDIAAFFHKPSDHIFPPIQASVLLTYVLALLIIRGESSDHRLLYAILTVLLILFQVCVNIERTGMVCTFLLLGGFAWLRFPRWWFSIMVLSLLVAISLAYALVPSFHQRVYTAYDDVVHYSDPAYTYHSVCLRLAFLEHSWALIKQRPLLGYGTGSFPAAYVKTGGPNLAPQETVLGDPHNSYAHVGVQLGLLGLFLLLGWIAQFWRVSHFFSPAYRLRTQCGVIIFAVSNMFIAGFCLNQTCYGFILMMSIVLGKYYSVAKQTEVMAG